MFSINKKYLIFLALAVIPFLSTSAQNINTPNNPGPQGLEVNTLSGNLFLTRNDAYASSRGIDINCAFYYNSFNFEVNIGFGNGWSSLYSASYRNDSAAGKTIIWGDAREDSYILNANIYVPQIGIYNSLTEYQSGKFLVKEPGGLKYYFDNPVHKKITRMEEPNGNFLNFSYNDTLLTAITNTGGQTISFAYNSSGNLQTITDAITTPARIYSYNYDNINNLKQVTDPLGGKIKYTYLVNGPVKTVADKNDNIVDIIYYGDYTIRELIGCNKRQSYSYDTTLKITTVTDYLETGNQINKYKYENFENISRIVAMENNCCGYNMSFEYDSHGNKTKQTDANGHISTYTYDNRGNVLTIKDPLNQTVSYTYSPDFSRVTGYTDAKGVTTNITYDANGNMTQITEPGNLLYTASYNPNGDMTVSTDPKGNTFNYNYDPFGNPVTVTGPNGYHASLGYDPRGNLISYTDALSNAGSMEYDILDRLKKITDPLNNSVQFSYDAEGNPTLIKNKNNENSLLKYDASNRPVEYKDAVGNKTSLAYDAMDNITGITNPIGANSTFGYDTKNRLSTVKDALGNITGFNYDAKGNIIAATLPNGQQYNFTFDNLDRLTVINDLNGSVAQINYDKNNNIISFTNGTGANTTAEYDSINRTKKITDALGNSSVFNYDKNSNVISVTDKNGFTKSYSYDSLNHVKTITDNNGSITSVTYDAQGNVIALKDADNNITNYTYDNLNRIKRITYPDGLYKEYSYDNKGNVILKKLTDASVITFTYDTLNRVISKNLPDGQIYNYTYDAIGRIKTATNIAGTVMINYDLLNRVVSESFNGRTVNYSYNISGRSETIVYPDSTIVSKLFDARNRLIRISKNGNEVVSYTYNNANGMTSKTFANGVITSMQYDNNNRLINYTTANGGIQNTNISYDNENNKTALTRVNNASNSEQFGYDNAHRLISYKKGPPGNPVLQNTYQYDAVGNRTNANLNGVSTGYTVNNLNQLVTGSSVALNVNYTYDLRGNLTYDGIFYKKYDAEGRLQKDSSSPSNVLTYLYDAFGRRVQKNYNGNLLKYTFAGLSQIEERDGAGIIKNKTVFNNFMKPITNEKNGSVYYYHANELNSIEAITNSAGNTVEKYEYDVYGKQIRYDSSGNVLAGSIAGNLFGFTGQQYDSATNNNKFLFREYSPATGTFNERDLIGYADGMGMYQYVGNNPANGIDILGLENNPCPDSKGPNQFTKSQQDILDKLSILANYLNVLNASLKKATGKDINDRSSKMKKANMILNIANLLAKIETLRTTMSQHTNDENQAEGADILVAGIGILNDAGVVNKIPGIGPGMSTALSVYGAFDAMVSNIDQYLSGEGSGTSFTKMASLAYAGLDDYSVAVGDQMLKTGSLWQKRFNWSTEYMLTVRKLYGDDPANWTQEARDINVGLTTTINTGKFKYTGNWKPDCPQNKNPGGTRKHYFRRFLPDGTSVSDSCEVVQSKDPNAILGPDGVNVKKWVSVHDVLPYTILYENDKTATAPAKYIKIIYPIDVKQDPATFTLGSFGFNNLTFTVPANSAAYSQRLDARDSLGLFVDITAGYDVTNNKAFWEFQSIDPLTLLPPTNPSKGFLLMQDSTNPGNGHAFVNFNIKPKQSDITLDTIHAEAQIVFDGNDTIPTNYHTNTVDAFAPVSHMNALSSISPNPVHLTWTGADDAGGSGIKSYTLYVSTNGVNFYILKAGIARTDTSITLARDSSYCFFVLATDSTGNVETLRQSEIKCTLVSAGVVPVSWLYFRGSNRGKNNLLEWATESEHDNHFFELQRSLTGNNFVPIANILSHGNSNSHQYYSYEDPNIDKLNSAIIYYRIKQTDIDGQFKLSNVVRLNYNLKEKNNSIVYPNPTPGNLTIIAGENSLIGTVAIITDVNGQVLQKIKITGQSQVVNLSSYSAGTYFIQLQNKEVLRVIKQ